MNKSEVLGKIRALKTKLDEMRQYKIVMAEEGTKPDRADKERESDLIVRLIRLEKVLADLEGRPYKPKGRGDGAETTKGAGARDRFARGAKAGASGDRASPQGRGGEARPGFQRAREDKRGQPRTHAKRQRPEGAATDPRPARADARPPKSRGAEPRPSRGTKRVKPKVHDLGSRLTPAHKDASERESSRGKRKRGPKSKPKGAPRS